MRRSVLAFALCATVFCSAGHAASGIGVFADANASDCNITIPANTVFDMYVVAFLGGDVAATCGIRRADLRITGIPAGWFWNVIPNPGGSTAGHILEAGGSIEFPGCQPGPLVGLYRLNGFATSAPTNVRIRAEARTDVGTDCVPATLPWLTACDQDATRICAVQSELVVNGPCAPKPVVTPAAGVTCLVAIEGQTWGTVKRLYGD
jgi:hypothetical protein